MNIGFLGTGAITSAMVTGLCSEDGGRYGICVSPRNQGVSAQLAARFPQVTVAESNQAVLEAQLDQSALDFRDGRIVSWSEVKHRNHL